MVKVGFICEGETERLIVQSVEFNRLLQALDIQLISPVIDAKGNGNLLPKNIEPFRSTLIGNGASKIVVLTDLDEDACITSTRERITERENQIICIAVKEIEAWFLADSSAMSSLVNTAFTIDYPEQVNNPFDLIRIELQNKTGRGVGNKLLLVKKVINSGFSIANAAQHPACSSARYFLTKLQSLTA